MDLTYRVLMRGPKTSGNPTGVRGKLAQVLNTAPEQVDLLLSPAGHVVQSGLSFKAAAKFYAALETAGAACMVEPECDDDPYLQLDLPPEILFAPPIPETASAPVAMRDTEVARSDRSVVLANNPFATSRIGKRASSSWKPNRVGIAALGVGTITVIVALGIAGVRVVEQWPAAKTGATTPGYSKSSVASPPDASASMGTADGEPASRVTGSSDVDSSTNSSASVAIPTTSPLGNPSDLTNPLSEIPSRTGHVTDAARLLIPAVRDEIETALGAHEQATSNQIAVLTVQTTQPESADGYLRRVAKTWDLDSNVRNTRVLVLVVEHGRSVRIGAGTALDRMLTDDVADRIISEAMAEPLRQGDYDKAVRDGVAAITAVLETPITRANTSATVK